MVGLSVWVLGTWIEDPGSLSSGNSRLLMIFVGLVALSMVTQVIIVAVLAVGVAKGQKKLMALAQELHGKAIPVIQNVQDAVRDTVPKVKVITENCVETSHIVRAKAHQFDVTLSDANEKTRVQVARVDGMVTTALGRTAALAETIHDSIRMPVKQVAGVVTGFKVGLDVLLSKAKKPNGYSNNGL